MNERLEPIIGVEIVAGDIRLGHTFYEIEVLENFIQEQKQNIFIEIGVHEGGMSYLLIPKLPQVYYVGIELHCDLIRPIVKAMYEQVSHAQLLCMDCFSDLVHSYLYDLKGKIVYCDGGSKAKEILHFKDTLHSGDVIMCHDFYDGKRQVRGVPKENISVEVTPNDTELFDFDVEFERIPEDIFKETRIVGWRKL